MALSVDFFSSFWNRFSSSLGATVATLPYALAGFILAVLVVVFGWLVGLFLKRVTITILDSLQVNQWTEQHGLGKAVGGVPLSTVAGSFVKWYTILLFVVEASNIVQFSSIRLVLQAFAFYLPVFLRAALIVVFGLLFARFMRNKIEATEFKKSKTISRIAEYVIVFLAVLIGARDAGIDVSILETAFLVALGAFVLMVALIAGFSFGLSYKKEAQELISDLRKELG
ncbi:MAG: hypothetical protein HY917_04155 [Candidatus Diapherotrites archaeon]|nr:hypothetical protein [Candidatus Diapherotrites archaeon]